MDSNNFSYKYIIKQNKSFLMSFFVLIFLIIINWFLQPNIFGYWVFKSNLTTFMPLIITAIGQTFVILSGSIDLSIGGIITLVNVSIVTLFSTNIISPMNENILLVLLIGLLVGAAAGFINGIIVAFLRLQAIIATFATNFIWLGISLLIMSKPGGSIPASLFNFYKSDFLKIPIVLYILIFLILIWLIFKKSRIIRYIYAVGGSAHYAYASGIKVNFIKIIAYTLAGLMAGMAGIVLTLDIASGDPLIGNPLTLTSIVAVVIGGTAISGGKGGVGGSIIGAVILGIIRNIIFFANVPSFYQDFISGVIIIAALVLAISGSRGDFLNVK